MRRVVIFATVALILLTAISQAQPVHFTLLHTNDEHSALIPYSPAIDFNPNASDPTIGGFARLATAVKEIREKESEPVILVSSGDFVGGTPFSWLIPEGYSPEIILMKEIGYNVVTIGNHEFDYTAEKLESYLINAGYPEANEKTVIVATNSITPPDSPLKEIFEKYHVIQLDNGLKIGFIGIIGEDAQRKVYSHKPVEFEDPIKAAKEAVEELKAMGVDVIVALSHSGIDEDLLLAEKVPEIDIIIAGHDHRVLEEPILTPQGTIIAEAGEGLRYLGILELEYNAGKVKLRNHETGEPFLLKIDDSIPVDPEINSLVNDFKQKLDSMICEKTDGKYCDIMEAVAVSDFSLATKQFKESNIGNFITDAMRLMVEKRTGEKVDFAVFANGEIRGNITPGTMSYSKGKISLYDMLYPVSLGIGIDGSAGYSMVSFYLTGEEIYRVLEISVLLQKFYGDDFFLQVSGLRYYYNPQNALIEIPFVDKKIPTALLPGNFGAVVKIEKYEGEGVQDGNYVTVERDSRLYRVLTDNYILSFIPKIAEVLPQLKVVPKDKEKYGELVVNVNEEELKVWQVVVDYLHSQPVSEKGIPEIDSYYSSTKGRINEVWSFPVVGYPILILCFLIAVVVVLKLRR